MSEMANFNRCRWRPVREQLLNIALADTLRCLYLESSL
jgi:hypothetical protein